MFADTRGRRLIVGDEVDAVCQQVFDTCVLVTRRIRPDQFQRSIRQRELGNNNGASLEAYKRAVEAAPIRGAPRVT